METKSKNLESLRGTGGDSDISPEDLMEYQRAINDVILAPDQSEWWRQDGGYVRFNLWRGAIDGRVDSKVTGKEAYPYEGAADNRIFLVDDIIEEVIDLCMTALLRAQIECEPVGGAADEDKARKATVLLKWLIGKMGKEWLDQHEILLNFMCQDTPAVAMMRIGWHTEQVLEMEKLTREELGERIQESEVRSQKGEGQNGQNGGGEGKNGQNGQNGGGQGETTPGQSEAAVRLEMALAMPEGADPAMDEWLVATIMGVVEGIKPGRAKLIARALRRGEEAEYPHVTDKIGWPRLDARRFAEDFFVPQYTRRFEDYMWFETEWLTGSDVRAKRDTGEWNKEFCEDVLANEGKYAFPLWEQNYNRGTVSGNQTDAYHKGEYQVVWVWHMATNADGIRGRYYAIIHQNSKHTAFGRRLYREGASHWPAVVHRRENLDSYLLDSRGVGVIAGPTQGLLKAMYDNCWDHADISMVPPLQSNGYSNAADMTMEKLGIIATDRPGAELKYLAPQQAITSGVQTIELLKGEMNQRWKRRTKDSDPASIQMREERIVGKFLAGVEDELSILFDTAMNNMSDTDLQMVMLEGQPIARSMKEIEGKYDVRLRFNPMELDQEKMTKLFKVWLPAIQKMANDPSIDIGPINRCVTRMAFPNVPDAVRPKNAGLDKEIKDEQHNLAMIRNGLVPTMDEEGKWNYKARAEMYEKMEAQSPIVAAPPTWGVQMQIHQVWADMGPDKYGNLLAWREALAKQDEQHGANAEIGRSMVKGAQGEMAEPVEE